MDLSHTVIALLRAALVRLLGQFLHCRSHESTLVEKPTAWPQLAAAWLMVAAIAGVLISLPELAHRKLATSRYDCV